MKLLIIATIVHYLLAFNLEFNSNQFPNWIKAPMMYSSFRQTTNGIAYIYQDSFESSCVYFMPVHDESSNKSEPYIFEPKCYTNGHCNNEVDRIRENNMSYVFNEYLCPRINGTIDKVGIFSLAEYSYGAQAVCYTVYIIIEGCSATLGDGSLEHITWILTNDTKYKPTILKHYLINLPVNDNKFFFGQMTFDNGDKNCSNLCSEIICEKSFELNIRRNGESGIEEEESLSDTSEVHDTYNIIPVAKVISWETTRMYPVNESGIFKYVAIVIVVVFVMGLLSYLVYHTLY